MDLSPRHRMILKTLVEDFVEENKPIGSKTLSEKYNIGLSPATVRNVFKELEDDGFIHSLHSSGGRIPTEKGYRFYVDTLISLYELTLKEKQRIQEEYLKAQLNLDQILNATSKVLSILSEGAGVVLAPKKSLDTLKHVELIHVTGDEILMILVTRSGVVVNKKLFMDENISQESLSQISRFLNEHIKGFEIDEIYSIVIPHLLNNYRKAPEEFYRIGNIIRQGFQEDKVNEVDLYVNGLQNVCNHFSNMERLECVMNLLEDKKLLRQVFSQYVLSDGVATIIGDKDDNFMSGVSIVASNYKMGEKKIGSIGILGPQRMNYTRVLSLVDFTSRLLSEMITKISK